MNPNELMLQISLAHKIIESSDHIINDEDGFFYEQVHGVYVAKKIADLPLILIQYYNENVKVNGKVAVDMTLKTIDQIGPLWLNERNKRITGILHSIIKQISMKMRT